MPESIGVQLERERETLKVAVSMLEQLRTIFSNPTLPPWFRLGLIFVSYASTAKADVTITPEMIRNATGISRKQARQVLSRLDAITRALQGREATYENPVSDNTATPAMIHKATGISLERATEVREGIDAITQNIPRGEA